MHKPIFFAFYPKDFADDIDVCSMSTLAVGAYILLLCKSWQSDPPCSLPNDDQILARLARLDAVSWAEVRSGVLSPFTMEADGSRWHQKRLRTEYNKAVAAMKQRSERARKGGQAKHANRTASGGCCLRSASSTIQARASTISDSVSDSDSPKRDGDPGEGKNRAEVAPEIDWLKAFDAFWAAYPSKTDRLQAMAAWQDLMPSAELLAAVLGAIATQKHGDKWQRGIYQSPARWLRDQRWTDEVTGGSAPSPEAEAKRDERRREQEAKIKADHEAVASLSPEVAAEKLKRLKKALKGPG